ncbi:MAG: hypothetical protein SVM79_07120 [Chloroflexota bacterium]|nr:hypothetical protein [Chloroflexota bacterium]
MINRCWIKRLRLDSISYVFIGMCVLINSVIGCNHFEESRESYGNNEQNSKAKIVSPHSDQVVNAIRSIVLEKAEGISKLDKSIVESAKPTIRYRGDGLPFCIYRWQWMVPSNKAVTAEYMGVLELPIDSGKVKVFVFDRESRKQTAIE